MGPGGRQCRLRARRTGRRWRSPRDHAVRASPSPIGEGESLVRLAHIDNAHADGSVTWAYAYVHLTACATPRPAPQGRPDTGGWDAARGIGGFRT